MHQRMSLGDAVVDLVAIGHQYCSLTDARIVAGGVLSATPRCITE